MSTHNIAFHEEHNIGFNEELQIKSYLAFNRAATPENQQFAYAKTKVQISCAVTAQLISTFVFATQIIQFFFYLNPKLQTSILLL